MSELKLFLADMEMADTPPQAIEIKPIENFISGSFIESGSLRVFLHESTLVYAKELNITDSQPAIPTWLYKYSKIFNNAKASEIVFLDTETTGLERGAGTYAFLTGLLYFHNEKWHLKQYFIESPAHEILLMEILAKFLSQFKVLVSYNGKSYDIPLLDNRFKYHKSDYSIRNLEFLDLLHLSRRFWKTVLPGCKLQNIETLVLDFTRDYSHDIPGELIPKAYFDYLASNNAEEISNVFYHNEEDLYSLTKILEICTNFDFANLSFYEKYKIDPFSVAKLLLDIGLEDLSLPLLKSLTQTDSVSEELLLLLASLLKRQNDYLTALEYLKLRSASSPLICLEISKIYEHKIKNLTEAFYYARKAYLQLHEEKTLNPALIDESEKRITRLKKKMGGN